MTDQISYLIKGWIDSADPCPMLPAHVLRHCFAFITAGIVIVGAPANASAQTPVDAPLQLESRIPLGDVRGRIDHLAIDLVHRRLFVAELGNDSVGVVDLGSQRLERRLDRLSEPQGVTYVASNDSLYVANGGDGSLCVFRGPGLAPDRRIELGGDADNVRIDPESGRLFVGHGKGAIAVVDAKSNERVADYRLKAHPEGFQLDGPAGRLFVNVPDARTVAVLDAKTGQELASWPMGHGANFPMAIDDERQRVLVAYRSPPRLAAFNQQSGAVERDVEVCGDADDVFIDRRRARIYVSCGAGFLDVFKADGPNYSRLARIPTLTGARTALFVPEMDRLFLAVRARSGQPAAIWVYRPAP